MPIVELCDTNYSNKAIRYAWLRGYLILLDSSVLMNRLSFNNENKN